LIKLVALKHSAETVLNVSVISLDNKSLNLHQKTDVAPLNTQPEDASPSIL
jgi:hypothetical protein